jgi:hypothetical protein
MADMPRPPVSPRGSLTKEDILAGKEKREILHLDAYGKDVVIRPLTDGEFTEVFKLFGEVPIDENGYPDLSKVDIHTNLIALRKIASLGLVEPKLSEDEIAQMKFGVPGIIAHRILEISGLAPGSSDEAKKFRADTSG